MERKQEMLARRGLTLSRRLLRRLDQVGIFVQPQVSLEHQSLAKQPTPGKRARAPEKKAP